MERKAIVADRMQLTEEEGQEFWPIYSAYLSKHEDFARRSASGGPAASTSSRTSSTRSRTWISSRMFRWWNERAGRRASPGRAGQSGSAPGSIPARARFTLV